MLNKSLSLLFKIGNSQPVKMSAEVSKFVEDTIKSKPVVIFSKTYCPFCVKVKDLFANTLKYPTEKTEVIELEDRPDCAEIQAKLKEITGASSVSNDNEIYLL